MEIRWLGRMDYLPAWELQREVHEAVVEGAEDTLLLVEHEPVYTAGRRTKPEDRPPAGVPVVDVDRGGEITWHGPGQLTGYPILRLPPLPGSERDGMVDVVAFVRRVEQLMIDVAASFGVDTVRVDGRSGVWVPGLPPAKVGAVGIRVARSVTMHGFALNADCDLAAFGTFNPCGITDAGVTSLTEQTGRDITVDDVRVAVTERASTLQGTLVT